MTLDDLPDVVTVSEFAQLLHVSDWTGYELVRSGKVRALRLGRLVRITRTEVERFLEERRGE